MSHFSLFANVVMFMMLFLKTLPVSSVKKKAAGSALTVPLALPRRQKRLASGSDTSKTLSKPQR